MFLTLRRISSTVKISEDGRGGCKSKRKLMPN